ncbi:sensor histidine kinase [Georgenia sp. H159]|uniref:sensor histidine kinase n=1 Tax=Georgenia sp. H159 TaxID=3076115 RepID=UPI002D78F37A|nr:ATP-binding protein [Georgenia sp. H159]
MADAAMPPVRARQVNGIWLALPYALLVVSSALSRTAGDLARDEVPWVLALGVAVAGWHTWWAVLHPGWLERALAPMAAYFTGLVLLTAVMFHLSFTFFPLYLVCFAMAFVALPGRWAYAGVSLTTALALLGPGLLTRSAQNAVVTLAGGALAAAAGWSIRALETETRQRREAMAELTRTQAELERALAQNLALRDRLVVEARQAGVAAERTRLAGEIHDTLAGGLAGVLSQLEAIDAQLEPGHGLHGRVQAAAAVARETLREARRSVRELRPGQLDRAPLGRALAEVVRGFERTRGLPVVLHVSGTEMTLPAPVEDTVLRAAQEALTNIDRHARASTAHVTLTYLEEAVALDVADDGHGVDGAATAGGGQGLAIMTERVEAVGGRVDLGSEPGRGTTLTITVPLGEARH